MNAKKSKTKNFYWDPSGEEIYKSKLDSANRKIKKDIREYQEYPFEFWIDLVKIILKFISYLILFGFILYFPFSGDNTLSFSGIFILDDYLNFLGGIFILCLILLIFSGPFFYIIRALKYMRNLQKTLIINSLCLENNWGYKITKTNRVFLQFSKKFRNFFDKEEVSGSIGNQIWGNHKKFNFSIGDIDYSVVENLSFIFLNKLVKKFWKIWGIKIINNYDLEGFTKILFSSIIVFSYFIFGDIGFVISLGITWFLFLILPLFIFWLSGFEKHYSFLAIHLPKKNYQNLVLKPQKIFEKDLVGVESVKLSELFKIEGGEKIKDIKILSPKIQVGIEEMLNIQKIHSILFQGDTVIFLFHQPFFKKLYTDFSDGMKISQEGEIKFFQKIETMMKIVKKF